MMISSSSNLNILGTPPSLREWRPNVNTKYQEAYQNNHEEHLNISHVHHTEVRFIPQSFSGGILIMTLELVMYTTKS